ncbi:MAG: nucleoside triphosphate pyrophosphohydrolase [Candidatus Erginobacter occultus]|nr:nucleoside triphosphate pyrophosphohydrolase [Candidatus Erginobacter occultus]
MEKLVRDRIPEIIAADRGAKPSFRVAPVSEYRELLAEKLREETAEYLESRKPEELADILEVVFALGREAGLGAGDIERIRREKALERGGFAGRIIMDFP